jgi:polysaccharide deacetylase 2 family uncharacterized protein YibQ
MSRADFDKPLKALPPKKENKFLTLKYLAGWVGVTCLALALWIYISANETGEPWAELKLPAAQTAANAPVINVPEKPKGPVVNIVDGITGQSKQIEIGTGLVLPPPVVQIPEGKAYEMNASAFRPKSVSEAALPRIALIITGVGINASVSAKAIETLPPEITLGIAAPANAADLVKAARLKGFELLVQIPMEAMNARDTVETPFTLKTNLTTVDNLNRLANSLSKVPTAIGIINFAGDKFLKTDTALTPLYKELGKLGLLALDDNVGNDSLQTAKLAGAMGLKADMRVENGSLDALEALAKKNGVAIGTLTLLPNTAESVRKWAIGLQARGVLLTPLTATLTRKGY